VRSIKVALRRPFALPHTVRVITSRRHNRCADTSPRCSLYGARPGRSAQVREQGIDIGDTRFSASAKNPQSVARPARSLRWGGASRNVEGDRPRRRRAIVRCPSRPRSRQRFFDSFALLTPRSLRSQPGVFRPLGRGQPAVPRATRGAFGTWDPHPRARHRTIQVFTVCWLTVERRPAEAMEAT